MGKAPEIKSALQKTRERKWTLDPEQGGLIVPQEDALATTEPVDTELPETQPRPAPFQAAIETFD